MDFQRSAEQVAVQDALKRFISTEYGFEHRRSLAQRGAMDTRAWDLYTELGLLALPIPEAAGGLGGGSIDLFLAMQGFGSGLMLEPYVETAVLGAGLLWRARSHPDLVEQVMEGRLRLALAHGEPDARYCRTHVRTTARRIDGGWRLEGMKSGVTGAPFAQKLLMTARTAGAERDEDGIALFLVDSLAEELHVTPYALHDGTRAADLVLDGVLIDDGALVATGRAAMEHLDAVLDLAAVARCGEAIGAMEALLGMSIAHLQSRHQFGQPLAQFQALRHRVAEMAVHLEEARAIALLAAAHSDQDDPRVRRRHAAAAKALVGRSARYMGQQAVQLHGAMGLTDELAVGHYFKRLTMLEFSLGDTAHHLDAFIQASRPVQWAAA